MATTWTQRQSTDDEPAQSDDMRNAASATDWRRMTDVAHDHIAHRAYELYEERGREHGHDIDDWLKAEHEIEERATE
jgi:hypothetical protein